MRYPARPPAKEDEMRSRSIGYLMVLALVVPFVLLLSASPAGAGGFCRGTPVTDVSTDRVVMSDSCFLPTISRVDVGQSMTWLNKDATAHMVIGANSSWGGYEEVASGARTTVRFTKAGVYPYFCILHPGMIGAVVVGDGGASGATAGGAVSVASLPTATSAAESRAEGSAAADHTASTPSTAWRFATFAGFGLFVAATVALLAQRRRRDERSAALQAEHN
jgi:plastocyanin